MGDQVYLKPNMFIIVWHKYLTPSHAHLNIQYLFSFPLTSLKQNLQ